MKKEQFVFDERRGQVRVRFHEFKKKGQQNAPCYKVCTLDELNYRSGGRKRSEKEQQNLLARLYFEKKVELEEKQHYQEEEKRKQEAGLPIQEAMQRWLDCDVSHYTKNTTLSEYQRTCTLYLKLCGNHALKQFRKHHATDFQSRLKANGFSDAGIHKHQT